MFFYLFSKWERWYFLYYAQTYRCGPHLHLQSHKNSFAHKDILIPLHRSTCFYIFLLNGQGSSRLWPLSLLICFLLFAKGAIVFLPVKKTRQWLFLQMAICCSSS